MNVEPNKNAVRPPIIAVMGHIDHGKSTLLDYIRKANVVSTEAGGITQHLSAYEATHKDQEGAERKITFLDTPGHEAFKAMRERGATTADIAILVVSAEDGVKPQTLEALKTIKESEIPYIVAINKIDKPGANVERTKQNLAEHEIYIEGYGGSIPAVPISAKSGEGVPALLDMMLLVADLEELSADPQVHAEGFVLESFMDTKRGITATLIITNGSLKKGDCLVAGSAIAPVRAIEDFLGRKIEAAVASSPVRISGWSTLPKVGKRFGACATKKEAEKIAENTQEKTERKTSEKREGTEVIPVVVKADVLGTLEAVVHEIEKLETEKVSLKIVAASAGDITENDIKLATGAPGSIVLGFNVKPDGRARDLAERHGIEIKTFDIIYKLSEWFAEKIVDRTPKVEVEEIHGTVRILKTFSRTKDKQIVGGKVEDGAIKLGDYVKIMRRENEVGKGKITELQQLKAKTKEVTAPAECGMMVESKLDIVSGDRLQSFVIVKK